MPQGPRLVDFKAVLFDVDGTLVDSVGSLVPGLGDAFEKYTGKRPGDDEIKDLIGLPLRKQLALYRSTPPTQDELAEMTAYTIDRFEHYKNLERSFEPAIECLRLCHRAGIKTALVTSKSAPEVELFLTRFSGADYIHTVVCASDVRHPKPAPESALLACDRLGVLPSEAVMIGDSAYDVRCAKDAGVASVAVTYGFARAETLLAEDPDLLLESPERLLEWAQLSLLEATCQGRNQ